MKKILALLLSTIFVVSTFAVPLSVSADSVDDTINAETDVSKAVGVRGSDSFGNLLAEQIEENLPDSDSDDARYVVTDVAVEGNTATVSYYAQNDCTIVVAIYDEESGEMLASGNADVSAEEESVDITIETDSMPKYFALKAFMLDSNNNSLSGNYATAIYTEAIQLVKNSEVSDFDSDRVLNLDDDETTNFAVYANGVTEVPYIEGYNIPQEVSPSDGVYVFTNCNDNLKSLNVGDSFVYKYGNDVILIKIADIKIDGDTVTITQSDDVEMETFFEYIKIETEATAADIEYDSDGADESVTFMGIENEDKNNENVKGIYPSGDPININTGAGTTVKFNIAKDKHEAGGFSYTLSADVSIALKVTIKFYYNASWNPIEAIEEIKNAELEFGSEITSTLNGKVVLKGVLSIPLGKFAVCTSVPGVYIDFAPEFKVSASGTVELSLTINKYNGFKFSLSEGLCNTSKEGKMTPKLKVEGEFSVGIDFGPRLIVLDDDIMKVDVTFEVAAKITAAPNPPDTTSYDSRHTCRNCISGQVKLAETFGIGVKFLKSEKLSVSTDFSLTIPICSYYYSKDHDSFDVGSCPYKSYRVTFVIVNGDELVGNEELFVKGQSDGDYVSIGITNPSGRLMTYLEPGAYSLKVKGSEFSFTITAEPQVLEFDLSNPSSDSDSSDDDDTDTDSNSDAPPHERDTTAVIDGESYWELHESGTLYVYNVSPGGGRQGSSWNAPWSDYLGLITKIIVEDGIRDIGSFAFCDCYKATSIEIPDSVGSIGNYAFARCSKLKSIEIPDSVYSSIGEYAFLSCWALESVTIGKKVEGLDRYVFAGCESLKSIELPDGMTYIGEAAFYECENLISVKIPNSVKNIYNYAFDGCKSLKEVNIPNSVTSIYDSTFRGCSSLETIEIPNSVTSICESAFEDCSSLKNIVIPNSVTNIEECTFKGCSSLTNIVIPGSVSKIEPGAFGKCSSLTNITIPNSVTSIDSVFWGCSSLTSIVIPNSVTSMCGAFSGCSSLTSVTIPNSVTSIDEAFCSCSSLTSITIPNSVTSMNRAFSSCSSLKSIIIPDSVTNIHGAFTECTALTSVTIPYGITSIDNTFFGCSSLTSITIPDSVTSLESQPFCGCSSLTSITIPDSVTYVDGYAFSGCSSLTSIVIPDSVTEIDYHTFSGCSSLKSVVIPNSVTVIYNGAFADCDSLKDVYYKGSESQWNRIKIKEWNECLYNANIHYNYQSNASAAAMPVKALNNNFTLDKNKEYYSQFSNLVPNEQYIVMVVRSQDVDRLVATDNLVHIDQFTADENGKVKFNNAANADGKFITLIFGAGSENVSVDTPDVPVYDSDTDTETTTDSDTEQDTDTSVGSDTETESDTSTDSDTEQATDTSVDSDTESDTTTDSDTEQATDTSVESDTETESDITTDSDIVTDTDTEVESDTEAESDTSTDSDIVTDTDTEVESDTETESDTTTDSDTEQATDTSVESDTETETETDTTTDSDTDTATESDTEEDTDTSSEEHIHTIVTDEAVEPTCTEDGLTEGTHCSVCGEVITAQEVIPANGHNYVDGTCTVCGENDPEYDTPDTPDTPDIPTYVKGDITDDGKITASDALLVLRAAVGAITLTDREIQVADSNGDGKITATDALIILRYAVGVSTTSDVGKVFAYTL